MNPCEHKPQLTAYLLGELPEKDSAALGAHLAACPECRAAAAELRTTLALLRDALSPAEGPDLALRLDDTRRQRVLEIQPTRQPKAGVNWFAVIRRMAAVLVIGLGLFGIMSAALFPAVSNSVTAARRTQLALSVRRMDAAAKSDSSEIESESLSTAPRSESESRQDTYFGRVVKDGLGDVSGQNGWKESDAPAFESGKGSVRRALNLLPNAPDKPTSASGPGDRAAVTFDSGIMPKAPVVVKGGAYASRSSGEELAQKALPEKPKAPMPTSSAVLEKAKELSYAGKQTALTSDVDTRAPLQDAENGRRDRSKSDERNWSIEGKNARGGGLGLDEQTAAVVAPEGKVRLNIALPKPQFTGTPKDIRSPNLESARDLLEERSDLYGFAAVEAKKMEVPAHAAAPVTIAGAVVAGNRLASDLAVGQTQTAAPAQPEEEPAVTAGTKPVTSDFLGVAVAGKALDLDSDSGFLSKDEAKKPAAVSFNPFVATAAEPFSTFAMDVDTASYTQTRQAIRSGALPEPERVRTEEIVNAFDYGDAAPERAVFRVYQDGAQSPFGAGCHLLRIGVKGRRLGREEQRPAMLTFVIDVSGSMSQPDRIGLARLALTSLLGQLSERDRIQLIAYSDHARLVLEPVAASDKAKVVAAFERLQCNGSTNLEEGLRQAYEQAARSFIPGAENRVILISDGVANLGADSAQEILEKVAANRKQGITCSVFGVGAGTYNDRMLEELANKGDGVYRFLDSEEEVRTAFVDDLAATLNTIAKNAKIQVEWNPAAVIRYRQLGYENRALLKEQFRDDAVDAGEVGSGQSVTALYELELTPAVAPGSLLGTVRIRYQRADSGKVEEIEAPLAAAAVLRPAHAVNGHFRVAACAAEFAELLRGSPHAAGGRYQDVADYLRPAALELSLDTRVKELLGLISAAAAIKGR